jgi:pimeloyl-ACP methyl ester carboxylesterase
MTSVAVGGVVAEVEGDGFPVVMLHGLGGTTNVFQPQLEVLGGYRVIRMDLPGSGRSPLPAKDASLDDFATAIAAAARALGVTGAHFVGHSLGTIVCQKLAVAEPDLVRSLTLLGALAAPAEATRTALHARAELARREGMAGIADQIVANALASSTRAANPAAVAFVRESLMRQDPEGYARCCEALARAEAADARRIAAPTLLVTGDADAVNPPSVARALQEKIAGARLTLVDRGGHWLTVEKPAECNRRIAEFLKQVEQ